MNHEKVVQPLPHEESHLPNIEEVSTYMTEPPAMGGTLTASTQDDIYEPSTDPLSSIPDSPFPAPEVLQPAPPDSPLLREEDDAESVRATELTSTESIQLPSDGDTRTDVPLGPVIEDGETLADIEKSIQAYTGEPPHGHSDDAANTEAARQAVIDAVSASGYDSNRPEPIQALGAQPLGEDINHEQKPPVVPPPILSQEFVLPDENGNIPPQN